jgi:hypothetical protein
MLILNHIYKYKALISIPGSITLNQVLVLRPNNIGKNNNNPNFII